MRVVLSLVALSLVAVGRADAPREATELVASAQRTAAGEHKAVFVHFGASWCGWCRQLNAFLADAELSRIFAKYFVVVGLDVQEHEAKKVLENPGALSLLGKFGGERAGLPFFVLLDSEGHLITTSKRPSDDRQGANIGYPATPDEIAWFIHMLRQAAPAISEADVQTLAAHLRAATPAAPVKS